MFLFYLLRTIPQQPAIATRAPGYLETLIIATTSGASEGVLFGISLSVTFFYLTFGKLVDFSFSLGNEPILQKREQ